MNYLRTRYYDPATGRFLTVDATVQQTRAPYGYANGNPITGSDPTGLCSFLCKVAIGAGVGIVVAGIVASNWPQARRFGRDDDPSVIR